jgi:hypothetical protein
MNLSNSSMEMNSTLKDLRILWEDTKAVWNDTVRQDFEIHQWQALELRTLAGIRAIERFAPILDKMQRDCE